MSNEWYTPAKYIEAAREVMGSIDLDPASCALANQTVRAARYYTQEDNGLMHRWYGNVWLNPPYGRVHPEETGSTVTYQAIFSKRALALYTAREINQAILLLHGYTCYKVWFEPFWDYPICFHRDFIPFYQADGTIAKNGYGGIIVYLGSNFEDFIRIFSKFGRIAKAVDVPVAKPRQLELIA